LDHDEKNGDGADTLDSTTTAASSFFMVDGVWCSRLALAQSRTVSLARLSRHHCIHIFWIFWIFGSFWIDLASSWQFLSTERPTDGILDFGFWILDLSSVWRVFRRTVSLLSVDGA